MSMEPSPFQEGEYIILTRPYDGIPEGSVGMVIAVEASDPPCYHVHFGWSLPNGPIPQDRLAPLKRVRTRGRVRSTSRGLR
jgi:hypothetical protein